MVADLTANQVQAFRDTVYGYYAAYGRDLPWRRTTDPYRILVSEMMLQQTQVARVVPKYTAFLEAFPDVWSLAAASVGSVLGVWRGLGYNRRALALKRAAETLGRQGGRVPRELVQLQALPGVGPATAAAVRAFAFNLPVILVETNIRSVFLCLFFPGGIKIPDREVRPLVETTLDRNNPRRWYWALMDYGVWLKRAYRNPSRRSAGHRVQSPFEGSDRQIRGEILRYFLDHESSSLDDVAEGLSRDTDRVREMGAQLHREGFLVRTHGRGGVRYVLA